MSHKAEPPALGAGGTADERSTKADSDTYPTDLRRRRAASWRLPVLESGRSDLWHYEQLPLTDHQLDAWVATIAHLDDHGVPAIVPVSVHRALRRRYAA
jgi:hypothetical protein